MRRGDVRAAILLLLDEAPRNGYQVMQELEERSDGMWRPSPGSVYPALQLLADEGLVRGESREGSTVYELTDEGKKHVEENRESFGTPWQQAEEGVPGDVRDLFRLAMAVGMATRQVAQTATTAQRTEAAEILAETRRRLYGILASDAA
jgi:DNA-binding PadR family transcriptional regulator